MQREDLPNKYAGETRDITFDFTSALADGETISTQTVTAAVYSGEDSSPASLISGSASASGAVVTQEITAGTLGVIYLLLCEITTSLGQTLQRYGYLAVIPTAP